VIHSPKPYSPNRLYADVEFLYDGTKVASDGPAAGFVDQDKDRVLVRDRDQEGRLVSQLVEHGACGAETSEHGMWFPQQGLPALVTALVGAGWIVEAEGATHPQARPVAAERHVGDRLV
jgi:hypothetical protein